MNKRGRGAMRGCVVAAGVAAVLAAMPAQDARAQAAPESIDAEGGPASTTLVEQLRRGAKVGTMLRLSYFSRTKPDHNGPTAEATGLGGWLFGETGEYANTLSFGGALAYVAKITGPDGHGGNFILKDPDQEGYSVLGVAYAKLRAENHALMAGRLAPQYGWSLDGVYRFYNRFDGAFAGRRDVRAMIPLAFEGLSVQGKFAGETVRYYGGYLTAMKQINDDEFNDLAEAAFLPGDSDGMAYIGAQWKINPNVMLQGGHHQVDNLLNMTWADVDMVHRFDKSRYIRLDLQYLYQTDNGDKSLGDFSMNNIAAYLEGRWIPWFIPYAMIGRNSDEAELRSPYSLGPSYLVQRIGENAKAGEKTWILGSTFDFETLGMKGLVFDLSVGKRTDRHVNGNTSQPLADWTEVATDLIYTFGKEWGWAEGVRVRARWARVWEEGAQFANGVISDLDQYQSDVRFDFQWRVAFK
ncbi:MAG TPA: OprD family outer membrane porin [Burkholderiales bacterium]|nr:OprD family outer membrane porin [Burkholderiales bacterium]